MLETRIPAHEKRASFRKALATGKLLRMPGAFNPLSAQLIQDKGFEGVYISGAVLSADLGLPDIGLTTLTEVSQRAGQIARVTDLPALVDADTGFGEPMNVARTVQIIEDAGLAGLHIEDQVNPKRCGHLDGKEVVDENTALKRIRAAVSGRRDPNFLIMARTDIRGVDSDSARGMAAAVDVPILANMTEFGKSELFTTQQLADVGVNIVIFPVSLLRLAMGAAERGLDTIIAEGSLTSKVPEMQTRARLYELVDYAGYSDFDDNIFTFDLRNNRS